LNRFSIRFLAAEAELTLPGWEMCLRIRMSVTAELQEMSACH
jgi:hypothetical protein